MTPPAKVTCGVRWPGWQTLGRASRGLHLPIAEGLQHRRRSRIQSAAQCGGGR